VKVDKVGSPTGSGSSMVPVALVVVVDGSVEVVVDSGAVAEVVD
jgi:hypothetical protein